MTNLIGAPRVPTDPTQRPTVTGTVRYTRSYAGGAAAGLGTGEYPIRYDWPASGDLLGGTWLLDTGTAPFSPIPLAAARFEQSDPAPEGVLIIAGTIRYPSGAAQAFEVRRLPVETSAGVLDLRVEIAPPAWTTPQQLADLIGDAQTATAAAQAAAQDALTAADGVGGTVTAALAPVGAALADLDAATDRSDLAATQALGVAGISATYVSNTAADPPAAPDGTRGARRDASGNLVLLTRTAGAWLPDALALASLGTVTGLTPDPDAGLRPVTPADLVPGMPMMHQRFVLLDRPRAGGALPGLGGVPMSVWDWEFQPMPWLTERELGAGELYVRAQVFAFTSATYPLKVRLLNTTFNQSADLTIVDVPDDENSGAGFYRWKRSAWLPIRDVTLLGRRVTPTLQCQILAPNGVVEIWYLALEFAWRR